MYQISDYELELMKIIWCSNGTAMYADIVDGLHRRGNDWSKNMIITLLLRLVEKKMITTTKIGRKNKYTSIVSEEEYKMSQTKDFVDKIYEGKMQGFVATLVEHEILSREDLNELKKYWETAQSK